MHVARTHKTVNMLLVPVLSLDLFLEAVLACLQHDSEYPK